MATKTFIGAGELITQSWRDFVKTWDTTVRYSAWIILVGVIQAIPSFLPKDNVGMLAIVTTITTIAALALSFWVIIRVYQVILALDANQKVTEKTTAKAMTFFWPIIWVGLLTGFATLGAFVLLVLPGIYVGVRLGFTNLSLLDKNKRGKEALADSWMLTKDKFWIVLWRQLAAGIVFGLLVIVIMMIATTIVMLGASGSLNVLTTEENTVVDGVLSIVMQIVQAGLIPLFFLYQIKLYKALRAAA